MIMSKKNLGLSFITDEIDDNDNDNNNYDSNNKNNNNNKCFIWTLENWLCGAEPISSAAIAASKYVGLIQPEPLLLTLIVSISMV